MSKTENAVNWMINLANDNRHGYDQRYRWGEKGDFDCSSAVITAWQNAGVPVKTNGATYTGNMYNAFKKSGFIDVTRSVNLRTGAGLVRGDVLLNRTHHTALYIGGGKIAQASINEKGGIVGGAPGDQTGREINISNYYNFPWNYVLRYNEPQAVQNEVNRLMKGGTSSRKSNDQIATEVIRGAWGNGSDRIRRLRNAGYDPQVIQKLVNQKMARH